MAPVGRTYGRGEGKPERRQVGGCTEPWAEVGILEGPSGAPEAVGWEGRRYRVTGVSHLFGQAGAVGRVCLFGTGRKRNARYLYKLPDGTWRLAHGMCPDGWIEAYAP